MSIYVVLAVITVVVIYFSATLAHKVYKAIAYVKRVLNDNASRQDSVKCYLDLVGDQELPPIVHLQLIINWLDRFSTTVTDRQKKRLDAAYNRLTALENTRYKTDLELRSHAADLNMIKRYLFDRGIGTVSVGHQTTLSDETNLRRRHRDKLIEFFFFFVV